MHAQGIRPIMTISNAFSENGMHNPYKKSEKSKSMSKTLSIVSITLLWKLQENKKDRFSLVNKATYKGRLKCFSSFYYLLVKPIISNACFICQVTCQFLNRNLKIFIVQKTK